jgi:transcriptional regulator
MNMKGSLSLLILQTLSTGPKHGYNIAQQIKHRSNGVLDFKEGSLYPALHTLEQAGVLEGYSGEENGRTRRYYQLTKRGKLELNKQLQEWNEFVLAVKLVMGEEAR